MASTPPNVSPLGGLGIAAVYATTMVMGCLVGWLGTLPNESYFSSKHNVFNVWFVKSGWFWTTIVFAFWAWFARNIRRFFNAMLRWALATGYWWLITQWMAGPSLTDRVYRWSGGGCYPADSQGNALLRMHDTSLGCRQLGGRWHGGHDLSGHILLLVHASLFLLSELDGLREAAAASAAIYPQLARRLTTCVRTLLLLWWWMLLMSSVYPFHPLSEKITGLFMGLLYWVVAYKYILPRFKTPGLPGAI
ncbi:inositol phospholipid synthesis and fat-storage-inducing TM-domain-containing protein [Thamnocephalis sphaerospora]|uniref:Inositol phospholipid synthesis and fat-storage-inducing TM-domain-containing protein n=1 Tax=Thamnocephalis sphaerospora TaxID=78915 RepID=A0A4P9XJZ6_9FUNG|nr:inositol phospholipid synthesis and fat-storage-inducing TM-domain-containing protein [Thamnocephalis sphaerospora]|eukprot:RKP06113.1 inositol phospholipid synthesis and fat-storage-inducing TM-domain-containing protein [Thamnocephalis sphaerospora]